MSSVIPDGNSDYALVSGPQLDIAVTDLFADLVTHKRLNCPQWTDESPADLGMQLTWLMAVLGKWLVDHLSRAQRNCFLATVTDREAARWLCRYLGYTLSEGAAAAVEVTFTCQAGHPGFTIPKGLRVATIGSGDTAAITFEVAGATWVPAGMTSVDLLCIQGETIEDEVLGSSDGTSGQVFACSATPVVWHAEIVEVYELADDATSDGLWTAWTRVDDFVNSSPTDRHYQVELGSGGRYLIRFGDGVNGQIPPRGGSNIRATYRRGGGASGNVGAATITQFDSLEYVESCTNAAAASGGLDKETIDSARVLAPALRRSGGYLITARDAEILAETFVSPVYGGIAKAKAFEVGGGAISVMIVPRAGKNPTPGLKVELAAYLSDETRRATGLSIQVLNPNYLNVTVAADVYLQPNYPATDVAYAIRNRLVALISPAYQDPANATYPHEFGRNIYLSDIVALIDATPGVDHVSVTSPTGDVIVPAYRIADIADINLTMHTSQSAEFAFYTTRDTLPAAMSAAKLVRFN